MNLTTLSGILFLAIAVFFLVIAMGKTISVDTAIINVQWFCFVIFGLLGIWRMSKSKKSKTRFTSLDEFYFALDVLIERLNADGHHEDALKLNKLIHEMAWTTGSELLGELMLALKGLKGIYSQELRTEIDGCFEFTRHHRKILGLENLDQ